MAKIKNETTVITNMGRLSYVHAFEPAKQKDDGEEKYSVSFIISKDDKETIKLCKQAIETAKANGIKEKWGGKAPKSFLLSDVLHDGDEEREDDAAYANAYYLSAKCKTKPGVVDAYLNPIEDSSVLYSGCYGRISVTFYAYDANGKKGIACGLNNIQKLKEGEPLGGRALASDDFDDDYAETVVEDDDL